MKYIYIILIIGIIYCLYLIIKELLKIGKDVKPVIDGANNIAANLNSLNNKVEVIKNNTNRNISIISNLILPITFMGAVLSDFFDTKPSKRKLAKSFKRQFKYKFPGTTSIDAASKLIKLIKN